MRKIILFAAIIICGCYISCNRPGGNDTDGAVKLEPVDPAQIHSLMDADSVSAYDHPMLEMPDPNATLPIHRLGRMDQVFNDSNYVHWQSAEKIGIRPITDTQSHLNTTPSLQKITPCADFYVEELNYSAPYLVPRAASVLHEIGRRFNDSLAHRSGAKYRIKVTSVLRTPENVRRLRRVNRNAVDSSVHQLATTFDISYTRFVADDSRITHSADELKALLAEVLLAMRSEGKCWVKYEIKQPCFHITARSEKP